MQVLKRHSNKSDKKNNNSIKKSEKTYFHCSYKIASNCQNPSAYLCEKCGACGRQFDFNGMLIEKKVNEKKKNKKIDWILVKKQIFENNKHKLKKRFDN